MAVTSFVAPSTRRIPRSRAPVLLGWASAGVIAALFSTLSLLRHARLRTTGYDLGIFEQSVRSYAEGRLPTSLLKGVEYPLLGDHFSPIVALLGPVYAIAPRVEVLLLAQAVLLAVGVVPLTVWAGRALGLRAAAVTAVGYGLAGGLAHAAAFDFHEIAFAVPLLALSLTALGRGRMRAAAAWATPLVLVKEDLGLTVAMIGAIVFFLANSRANRLLGLLTGVFGVVATTLETLVLIPAANPGGANQYTHQLSFDTAISQATTLFSNDLKITTVVLLLLPTAFVALRSPIVLVAVPTLAWRFLSDNPHYWGTAFHYDAVLVPIVTAAFVDGLVRLRRRHGATSARERGALTAGLVATVALLTVSPLVQLFTPELWQQSTHEQIVAEVLARIPDDATVSASNSLAPQLTNRAEVSLLGILPLAATNPQYVVADTSIEHQYPLDADELNALLVRAEQSGYHVIDTNDSVVLLRRPG